jgi:hypothetical protein
MPRLNLADAFRYFFSPIVFLAYLSACDLDWYKNWHENLNIVGTAAIIASGALVYLLYRFFLYDGAILWLHDIFRKSNY